MNVTTAILAGMAGAILAALAYPYAYPQGISRQDAVQICGAQQRVLEANADTNTNVEEMNQLADRLGEDTQESRDSNQRATAANTAARLAFDKVCKRYQQ